MAKKQPEVQDVIRAHRIELVDEKGKVRMLAETNDAGTYLTLYDGNAKERIKLIAYPDNPETYGDGRGEILMLHKDGQKLVIHEAEWRKL